MKPRRHARSTNAHARKLFPTPHGPVTTKLWRSAIHAQAPSVRTCWRLSRRGWVKSTAFERCRVTQLGRLQTPLQFALFAGGPFGLDQQTETLLEAERGDLAGLQLLLQGVGQRAQLHGVELVERLFDQHRSSSVAVVA